MCVLPRKVEHYALLDGVKELILCTCVDRLFGWTKGRVVTPSTCEDKCSLLTAFQV